MNNPIEHKTTLNLITGAAGHLGNVLARELLRRGESVRALILPGEPTASLDGLSIERVAGNILDLASLRHACEGVHTIFHMAGLVSLSEEFAPAMQKVNVDGTRNVIEAARAAGVKRLIYTSSIHALTRPPDGVAVDENLEFDTVNPAGSYDRTKAQASVAVQHAAQSGLDTVIVCPTGVIGPYDFRRSEMGEMILEWMALPFNWLVHGAFDFVDVRDVAVGHIRARDMGRSGETYILGGERISVSHLCDLVRAAVGKSSRSIELPHSVAMAAARLAEKYYRVSRTRPRFTRYSIETLISNSAISSGKARLELGYRPRRLLESITDTVAWWLENRKWVKTTVRI
jgi:dihydroflavonol-4-reductase